MATHLAPQLAPLIRDLAVILGVAGIVALLFQKIRQPIVLGYIIAGLLVGPHLTHLGLVVDLPSIRTWAELGVVFVMFSLGLEFSFRKLARVGPSVVFAASFEVFFMSWVGFAFAHWVLHWAFMASLFMGALVSISSTTIVIRNLDELKVKTRRFSQLILSMLIVEDLLAILILVSLSTLAFSDKKVGLELAASAGKLVVVVAVWFLSGYLIVPRLVRYVARLGNDEMLTIVALGLCLFLVAVAAHFDYSVALGAFIMGSILAESPEVSRIEKLMHPIRDVFAAVFFVSVGMLIDPGVIWRFRSIVLALTAVTVAGKIIGNLIGGVLTGFRLETAFQVGSGLAQIGEFSFIIAGLGIAAHAAPDEIYPIAVAVALLTTFIGPFLMKGAIAVAPGLESVLPAVPRLWLDRYSTWLHEKRAAQARHAPVYRLGLRWLLNGLVVTGVFLFVGEVCVMIIRRYVSDPFWIDTVGWACSVVIAAPFIWAMFSIFLVKEAPLRMLPLSRAISFLWLGAISLEFLSVQSAFILTALAVLFFSVFFRQISRAYHYLEGRLLSTFQPVNQRLLKDTSGDFKRLTPWDIHLVRKTVHANARIAGKTLAESGLKADFGLTVVAIQRGRATLMMPSAGEVLFPGDELLLLGTDHEMELARPVIEEAHLSDAEGMALSAFELKHYVVTASSPLSECSIRDSDLREKYGSTVVGIERKGMRIANPPPEMVLKSDDVLWLVGEPKLLKKASHDTFLRATF